MKHRKRWLGVAVVVALLIVVGFAVRRPVVLALVRHHVHDQLAHNWYKSLPDGLTVMLCGAGGPMPDVERSGPCSVVVAGKHLFVVDAGPGSVRNILLAGIPIGKVDAVLLTHYHSDHIGDLGELMLQRWVNGDRSTPLPVYGPPGVSKVVAGFNEAYDLDDGYRLAHHGPKIVPPSGEGGTAHSFPLPAIGHGQVVLQQDGLTITAFAVDHEPVKPAVGYRFDYKGRSLVFSGDTQPTPNLVKFARRADVLVSEGLSRKLLAIVQKQATAVGRDSLATILREVTTYHTTPIQAADEATQAGVHMLVFNHVTPPLPLAELQSIYLEGVSEHFSGRVELGRDGLWVSLPAGTRKIETGRRRL